MYIVLPYEEYVHMVYMGYIWDGPVLWLLHWIILLNILRYPYGARHMATGAWSGAWE